MRIPVSLLVLCAGIAGCTSSVDSSLADVVEIQSSPSSAAIRLNGTLVGRTPTKLTLDRTQNYDLQVGKGGYTAESTTLKPHLVTTNEGIEFGFPATIKVNLTKVADAGDAVVPAGDLAEFKNVTKKVVGDEPSAAASTRADIASAKEAATKIKAELARREAASKATLAAIAKSIAEAKAAAASDTAAQAKIAEAELALKEATAEAEAVRAKAENSLRNIESRRLALESPSKQAQVKFEAEKAAVAQNVAAADGKVAEAHNAVTAAAVRGSSLLATEERLAKLEASYAAEVKALNATQANSNAALKALNARTEELARINVGGIKAAKAEASKELADIQKALEEQKTAAGKAQEELAAAKAQEELAAAKAEAAKNSAGGAEKALAEAKLANAKALAEANANADKAISDANAQLKSLQDKLAANEKDAGEKLAAADKALAETKENAARALAETKAESEKLLAAAKEAGETKFAEATKAAEKALADARLDAEAKIAEATKVATEAKAKAEKLAYSEFNARYALLESRLRSKAITADQYKDQLAALRKELGL